MKFNTLIAATVVSLGAMVVPVPASAIPVAITTNPTLTTGTLTFSGFTCSITNSAGGLTSPDACNEINVGVISGGIQFSSGFAAGGDSAWEDVLLGYTVATSTGLITDLGLGFNGTAITFGGYSISQVVETAYAPGIVGVATVTVSTLGSNTYEDLLQFEPGYSSIRIAKDIYLGAYLGSSTISLIDQTFSTVPLPGVLGLLGIGALGLGLGRRRKRS